MTDLRRILILDDNENDLKLAREILDGEKDCLAISELASPRECLNSLKEESWDLVLSEIGFPGYGLFDVLDEMKALFPGLPVIILTGRGSEDIAAESMRHGASDYLKKSPENLERMPEAIDRVLELSSPRSLSVRNEECLKKLIRNSVDMLAVIDEKGNEKFVSDSVESITGFLPEEVLGKNCFTFLHPDDQESMKRALVDLLENPGGSLRADYRHRSKDGKWVHLEAAGTNYLDDPHIRGIVLNIRDITDRKQAEESLQRSRNHLDKLVRNSNDILLIMDEHGKELYISETVEQITGYSPEELIGSCCFDYLHPEDTCRIAETIKAGIENPGKAMRVEYRRRKKNGDWVYLEAIGTSFLDDPEISGIVVNARDITDRRNAEEALRKSEERLGKLIRNSNDMLVILEEDGREKYMSESLERITGFKPEEVLGTSCYDHFHPDDMEQIKQTVDNLFNYPDDVQRVEYRRKKKDGGWVYLEGICSNHLDDPDIRGVVVNARDITERKKVEKGLRDSRERYRRLASLLPEAVWEADLEGRIRFVNQKGLNLLGYSIEDIEAGINGFDFFAIPDRQMCMEKTMAVLQGAETEITEYRMMRKDGTVFPALVHSDVVREDGKPSYFIGIGIDITEHKQAEMERTLLAAAIEQSTETIVITDADGAIQYVNPAFEKNTGYSRREVVGRNPRFLQSGKQSAEFYEAMWQTLSAGETWKGELINKRRNESLYTEEATISPVLDDSGVIVNYVAVERDITEELEAAEERMKLEQQFQQAQKLESVGLLAGGVAHDLNNLLTPILGYGEMLMMDSAGPKARKQYAGGIVQAGRRARDIVNQLLAFSRKQSLEVKPVDLNLLLKRFEELLRRLIPEDIEINIKILKDLPIVRGDISQLEQVIMNLAINSRDAMPDGGCLTIETSVTVIDEESVVLNDNLIPGCYAVLVMSDTGLGMDAKTKAHIFEPFFSTKPKHKGSGLGLATVYGIIRQHGGDIKVFSQPLKGTTFKVFLPASSENPHTTREDDAPELKTLKGSETILLVEDDGHVRDLVLSVLERKGYKVLAAETGENALEILETWKKPIDLLLTDVVMPGINGKELFDRISSEYPDIKVIYMSGYSGEVIAARGVMDESVNFIQKPFSVQALARKIREVFLSGI